MDQQTIYRRRTFIAILVGIAILFIIGIVVLYISVTRNPYGDSVAIQNYDGKIENLSQDRKDSITAALYNIIKINSSTDTVPSINDAFIREGSDTQEAGGEQGQFKGSFIVDIPSIKQSYRIEYTYSQNQNDGFMSGYPVLATCLDKDELIYGDFNCKDIVYEETQDLNPILTILPHSTLSYKITPVQGDDGAVSLTIELYITEADRRIDESQAIAAYSKEALDWLRSQGYNPDEYSITYTY